MFQSLLRRFLAALPPLEQKEDEAFRKAAHITQYFYYILLFVAIFTLPMWDFAVQRADFSPVWSMAWTGLFDYDTAVNIIRFLFLGAALVGAFLWKHRAARFLAFLGILQFHAFESSFSAINHQWYLWVYVALLFVFLPDVRQKATAAERGRFLLVFWGAQAFILLTYSMSGLGKLLGAAGQMLQGQVHAFLPEAFSLHIAYWMNAIQGTTLLGPFIVDHPFIVWPFFVASMYVLVFALWAAFKPSLHKLWAFLLILFHIGTFLTMNILFVPPTLLLLILFFDSPFASPDAGWRKTLSGIPLFGKAFDLAFPQKTGKT
ncbi:MAG: hypothetical protein Q8P12_06520 [bacterium]|nr:hypothetical protein [bacterium]